MLLEGGVQAHCEGGSRPAQKVPVLSVSGSRLYGHDWRGARGRQLGLHLAARAITQWAQFGMAVALAPGTLTETSPPVEILMNYCPAAASTSLKTQVSGWLGLPRRLTALLWPLPDRAASAAGVVEGGGVVGESVLLPRLGAWNAGRGGA
jgi:hypothetical protein